MDNLIPDCIVGGSKRLGCVLQKHSKSGIFSEGGGEGDGKGLKFFYKYRCPALLDVSSKPCPT